MKDRPVIIEWEDACSNDGYLEPAENFKYHNPIFTRTCGFIVKHDRKRVIVASESFPTASDKRHIHTIPRKMVKRIIYLKEKPGASKIKEATDDDGRRPCP